MHNNSPRPRAQTGRRSEPPDTPAKWPPVGAEDWPIDVVLDRLGGCQPSGDGFAARCPAHHDCSPSLCVHETEDGTVLLHCHAGCPLDAILEKLGLKPRQLYASLYTKKYGRRREHAGGLIATPQRAVTESIVPNYALFECLRRAATEGADEALAVLAANLGLPVTALTAFGVGYNGEVYTFPECEYDGRAIGLTYRTLAGKKWCHLGSLRGLTLPQQDLLPGPLYVAEGATDAAALHACGHRAIGRPMRKSPIRIVHEVGEYLTLRPANRVIIVADNDAADPNDARDGGVTPAEEFAGELRLLTGYKISVAVARPIEAYKDVRELYTATGACTQLRPKEVR